MNAASTRMVIFAGCLVAASPCLAAPADWHDVKCVRYTRAWRQALAHQGSAGLGEPFLTAHQAFLDSNCTRRADVCARSPEELKLANTMVILSMNAGTASTFPPFYCRERLHGRVESTWPGRTADHAKVESPSGSE